MSRRIWKTSRWTTNQATDPSKQGYRVAFWRIGILLVIVLLPATVIGVSGASTGSLESTPASDANETANITISNQTITNGSVTIDHVTVPEGGYVVVHGGAYVFDDRAAPMGVSGYLSSGTYRNVTVPLNPSAVTNRTRGIVAAVVHRDDGDEQFDHFENRSIDRPYRESNSTVSDTATLSAPNAQTYTLIPTTATSTESKTKTKTTTETASGPTFGRADIVGLVAGGVLVALAVVVLIRLQYR